MPYLLFLNLFMIIHMIFCNFSSQCDTYNILTCWYHELQKLGKLKFAISEIFLPCTSHKKRRQILLENLWGTSDWTPCAHWILKNLELTMTTECEEMHSFFAKNKDIFELFMSHQRNTSENHIYDCSCHFTNTIKNLVLELDFNVLILRWQSSMLN